MPTSNPQNISPILETVMGVKPQSVLDIGVGTGKMGFLIRECLDLVLSTDGETWPPPRQTRIDGIEAHQPYITEFQRGIYDKIHIGDALEVLSSIEAGTYDLVLMIDVLEHFSHIDAQQLLDEVRRVGNSVLAVVPAGERPQGDVFGNAYERHRMTPTRRSLYDLGFASVTRKNGAYFASEPSLRLTRARWRAEARGRRFIVGLPDPVYKFLASGAKRVLRTK